MPEIDQNQLNTLTLPELSRLLARQEASSRQLVDQALAAIDDPLGEGARTFIGVHRDAARAAADAVDASRRAGTALPPLAGIPISIKDLFDEAGVVTLGASTVLLGSPAATRDSTVVERLRAAGMVIVGRTNMTEFAYSGLGLNPHYGTPRNAFDRATGRVPGGSSSGAAISVADGMAAAAIGTDTGGSVRIPAALNGLVGFKPTARRVPLAGVLPLAYSLDSAGPIAKSVADCAALDQILAGGSGDEAVPTGVRGLRFVVPTTLVLDDLSPQVASAFSAALQQLSAAGASIVERPLAELAEAANVNPRGAISSAEAYSWHQRWIRDRAELYDPRVIARIRPGEAIPAASYIELLQLRKRFIHSIQVAASGFDALLMPTVPDIAPTLAEVGEDDASYFRLNSRMLRNTSLVNLFDGCALSLPCHAPGDAPVGLMVAGCANSDRRILAIGLAIEDARRGCA